LPRGRCGLSAFQASSDSQNKLLAMTTPPATQIKRKYTGWVPYLVIAAMSFFIVTTHSSAHSAPDIVAGADPFGQSASISALKPSRCTRGAQQSRD
jgi:hypothetical protein